MTMKRGGGDIRRRKSVCRERVYLNTSTHKFHRPDCAGVKDMKEKNKKPYKGKRSKLLEDGYSPVKAVIPERLHF